MTKLSLKQVREQRRLKLDDVANFAGIAINSLDAIEAGQRSATTKQLQRLAETYGVPVYQFFDEHVPNIREPLVDFRKTIPRPAELSAKGLRSILNSEQISQFTKQLALELRFKLPSRPVLRGSPTERAGSLRDQFRQWRSSHEPQLELSGDPASRTLAALRLFLEARSVLSCINDAPPTDYLGFCISPDAGVQTVFVNRSVLSKKAQLFTLAHECAHVFAHQEGVSNPFAARNEIERQANIFAAEFLEPIQEFRVKLRNIQRGTVDDMVRQLSSHVVLSRHATAIRLREADYISPKQLSVWTSKFASRPQDEKDDEKQARQGQSSFGQPHAKRLSELGYLSVFLAARAVEKKLIDAFDVEAGIGLSRQLQPRAFNLATRRMSAALS